MFWKKALNLFQCIFRSARTLNSVQCALHTKQNRQQYIQTHTKVERICRLSNSRFYKIARAVKLLRTIGSSISISWLCITSLVQNARWIISLVVSYYNTRSYWFSFCSFDKLLQNLCTQTRNSTVGFHYIELRVNSVQTNSWCKTIRICLNERRNSLFFVRITSF